MSGNEMWFRFVADSQTVKTVVVSSGNMKIQQAVLYQDCAGINQITNDYISSEVDNTVSFYAYHLLKDSVYYLRLQSPQNTSGVSICIENLPNQYAELNDVCFDPGVCNIVFNNDFALGNSGFTTSPNLVFHACSSIPKPPPFHYGLCNNAFSMNSSWENINYPDVRMFIDVPDVSDANLHPSFQNTSVIWSQTITVKPNTDYCISGLFKNIADISCTLCVVNPQVSLSLLGNNTLWQTFIQSTPLLGIGTPWYQLKKTWNSGSNTSVTVLFTTDVSGSNAQGNDLGLYNISVNGVLPSSTITASATTVFANSPVTLTVNNPLLPNANVLWLPDGQTTPTITVNPQNQTSYTAVFFLPPAQYGGSDFKITSTILINVIPPPNVSFSFTQGQCMGNPVSFSVLSPTINTNYSWNFGDPASGTTNVANNTTTPTHAYTQGPGNYVVTLTAINSCGTFTSTNIIAIVPKISTYNSSCCSFTYPYTHSGDFTISSTVGSNTSTLFFQAGNDVSIKGTLYIKNNQTVTFTGKTVQFSPLGKIIIEPGSTLIVHNSILRGLIPCGTMWQGIEGWGDATKNQSTSQVPLPQGRIIIQSNSIIRDAHTAVALGQRNGITGTFVSNKGGGIITASNSSFINNGISIKFGPYYNYIFNVGKVDNCTFTSTTLRDPGYKSGNAYTYPNANNPFYGYANATGRAYAFSHLFGVRGVLFRDNSFNNAEYGVISGNSSVRIIKNQTGNIFQNLTGPIYATYVFSSAFFGNEISDNQFLSTQGLSATIQIHGGKYDVIKRNRFNIFPSPPAFVGLWMNNSSGFSIMNNQFQNYYVGIGIGSSAAGGGIIGNEIPIASSNTQATAGQGNILTECQKSIYTFNNNPALKIQCNNTNNQTPAKYQTNWDIYNTLANQGVNTAPAGNKFDRVNLTPKKDIKSNNSFFDYWRHNLSTVLPGNPQCIIPVTTLSPVTINVNQIAANEPQTFCDPAPNPCLPPNNPCRQGQFNTLASQLISLQAELNAVFNKLDRGQTAQLLTAINGNTNSGQLQKVLLQNSPLSDVVLLAFINLNTTPPGNFKNVLEPNSPVSENVLPMLQTKLSSLPAGIAKQIKDAQANQSTRTLTAIAREIAYIQNTRQLLLNEVIAQYIEVGSTQQAINLLEAENTIDADQQLVGVYLSTGDIAAASSRLNAMTVSTPEDQDFINLYNLQITLAQQDRTIFNMDSSEIALVRSIAEVSPNSLAAANAQSILKLVFSEDFVFPVFSSTARMMDNDGQAGNIPTTTPNEYFLGDNFPNPFNNQTVIPYYLPEGSMGQIRIYGINGTLLQTSIAKEGNNVLLLNTSEWTGGVYYYNMEASDKIIFTKKMVLIK